MTSTWFLAVGIGAVVGGLIGYLKARRPIPAAVVGAIIGLVVAGFLTVGPAKVGAVETPEEFRRKVLLANRPVLVDFYADWCPPCRKLAPTIETLAKDYGDRILVVKVNVDKGPQLAKRYGIRSIPTVILFVEGEPETVLTGLRSEGEYRQAIDAVLQR